MTTNTPTESETAPTEELFEAVASEPRQVALHTIAATEERPIELDHLAGRVAGEVHVGGPTMTEAERVRIALHHNHLPKLEATGLIQYDADAKTVDVVGDGLDQRILALIEPNGTAD
ncbi:DUF7344 domain-containing protein [Natranaeroarchaeum sulfidigenes]|uniref:Putative trancriptional regulator, ArsR family n=1 Tax=Natranaeroarchaeum sulfidigenes TaxID=2784880 RepID=A0A897MI10_9EURY|nr:hypothetical protein [Natranaeroarchaeum sulfidigenes]QSG01770.1 putative trancriptional regulator, ArsR family [Natranaeroarchaeum sulfidigenes]